MCSQNQHCIIDKFGGARCECYSENECLSSNENEIVCASDFREYSNTCYMKREACLLNQNIVVKHKGPCGSYKHFTMFSVKDSINACFKFV